MSYGRIARNAGSALLRASPVGGAVSKVGKLVSGIFGGGPPDRKASLRLRGIIRNARLGKPEAINRLKMMAMNQGSKFANINRQAAAAYQSLSLGAAPAGLMGSGGGLIGTRRRAVSKRRYTPIKITGRNRPGTDGWYADRERARRKRKRKGLRGKSGWVLYKGKRYSPKQARIFVPRMRRRRR